MRDKLPATKPVDPTIRDHANRLFLMTGGDSLLAAGHAEVEAIMSRSQTERDIWIAVAKRLYEVFPWCGA